MRDPYAVISPSSSSKHGLIHALKLTQLGSAGAVELTADADATWLHFDADDPETRRWLLSEGGLSPIAAGALTTHETRPRVLRRGDNLVLTLRGVTDSRAPRLKTWCHSEYGLTAAV